MTFAGLSKPEDRANVIAFLNQHSNGPLPMPAAPAEGAAPAAGADGKTTAEQKGEAQSADVQGAKAKDQPVQTEAQAAKQPEGNIRGDAAPATSGTSAQDAR